MSTINPHIRSLFSPLITGIAILVLSIACLHADDFKDLKTSIHFRMAEIQKLKEAGQLQEGPNGFLVPSAEADVKTRTIVESENSDRLRMFGIIANRSGKQVDEVARKFVALMPGVAATTHRPDSPPTDHGNMPESRTDFVPVEPGSSIPLKALARPKSQMYAEASESSRIVDGDVAAFSAWVVMEKSDDWYKLAESLDKQASGWMKSEDLMEWKHHMVVSFTHPGSRSRNLIFKEKETIKSLLSMPRNDRSKNWDQFIEETIRGTARKTVGIEPDGWVREKNQFYLLPILDQQEMQNAGQEVTLVKVAAATRERGASQNTVPNASQVPPMLDIVFVMDLTRSMGPFVKTTLEMLGGIATSFQEAEANGASVRFGFWGYRDDPELCKGIEFNTRNFTPQLEDMDTFLNILVSIDETRVDSIDYAEDVFAGVADAITQSAWREGAVRTILLVGDAPGRGPGEVEKETRQNPKPKGTAAGMDASALRALATSSSVYVAAYYLEASRWKAFTARGAAQFSTLASNPGSTEPVFSVINADNPRDYADAAQAYANQLAVNLSSLAKGGAIPHGDDTVTEGSIAGSRAMADNLFRNAFIEWNSANSELEAPRDIEGWMVDKDLADFSRLALEPGVLLTKTQLSELRDRMNDVLDALLKGLVSGDDFFKELHAVVTIGGRDPERIRDAKSLMESNHFPDFLKGLPYKSKIMGMTRDDWREMGADRTNQYSNEIVSKLKFYSEIYSDGTKWQRLNSGSDTGDSVTPIPIDMLP